MFKRLSQIAKSKAFVEFINQGELKECHVHRYAQE